MCQRVHYWWTVTETEQIGEGQRQWKTERDSEGGHYYIAPGPNNESDGQSDAAEKESLPTATYLFG